MQDIYQIEAGTRIDQAQSYIRAYPHLLAVLSARQVLAEQDLIAGAHMVYAGCQRSWRFTPANLPVSRKGLCC